MGTFLTGVGAVIFAGRDTANGLNFLKLFSTNIYRTNHFQIVVHYFTLIYLSFSQHSSVKVKF